MKTSFKLTLATLALGMTVWAASAQEGPGGNHPQRPGGQGGPRQGQRQMGGPLMGVLDANHDGVIDKKEIAHASAALKALDKNNDGKLTMAEIRPQRRARQGAGQDGAQGQRRQRRGQGQD